MRGQKRRGGAGACLCGQNGRRQVQGEREPRGHRRRLRDRERVPMQGSVRFVVMTVHEQLHSLSVMPIRPNVAVVVTAVMGGEEAHNPWNGHSRENQFR